METPSLGSHRLRKGRYSQPNQIYHVTTATLLRARIFNDFHNARTLIHTLRLEDERKSTKTLAFVVMPDHLHWLLQLQQGRLSDAVRRVKSRTSNRLGFRVWQSDFYDRALRREEDVREVARYIIANPLRAGLVRSVCEFPHWDAIWLEGA